MQDLTKTKKAKYIFVLDFTDERVYKYDVSNISEDEYEDYLDEVGHSVNNIQWMVTEQGEVHTQAANTPPSTPPPTP